MMTDKEKYFIETFIAKDRQERLLYEFSHEKKRYKGLDRFSHQSKQLLDPKKIIAEGIDLFDQKVFLDHLKKHKDEEVYIASTDAYYDGMSLSLEEAIRESALFMEAVIIIGKGYAIVIGEAMKGGSDKYLLAE
ncbi:MAG: hypothetical protein IKS54_08150 [Erysipelotrichaceae bacterium]|nr:hypothetical protein [Erysipelotrichaceae bacterium]